MTPETDQPSTQQAGITTPGRACVFCGGAPVTKEHVIPQWIAALFEDDVVDFSRTLQYAGQEPVVRPWSGKPFTMTAKAVCGTCNNGWMSRLETQAQPILTDLIRNKDRDLDAVEQHLVATWAVKTTLMLRLVAGDVDDVELGREPYQHLARFQSPPPGEQVWIASYAGEGQWPVTSHYFGAEVSKNGNPPDEENAHCSSFAVGHMAFSVIGNRIPRGPQAVQSHPPETWRVLWPTTGDTVSFPPPAALAGDEEMRTFATPRDWRAT